MAGNALLNLLINLPPELYEKIVDLSSSSQFLTNKVELEVLIGDNVDNVRQAVDNIGGTFENLGYGYGIITLPVDKIKDISKVRGIYYLELPQVLFTSSLDSNRAVCVPEVWQVDKLTGAGVLIGFIDTGIDYTLPAFRTEKGGTRIEYLYDLSQQGKVWNKKQIDEALLSSDPYAIVNFSDSTGHGTHVAGIACAGGNINRENYGVAYDSSIAMVKITGAEGINFSLSTQILRGIRFLIDRSRELNIPLVINLSWSSNDGAHNGSSILEQYINTVSSVERLSFVVSAGNEGDKAHHVGGDLKDVINIGMNVSSGENGVIMQFYKPLLADVSVEVINPSGNSSGIVKIQQGYKNITVGGDRFLYYYTGPKPFNINGEIIITLVSPSGPLTSGQWNIRLTTEGPDRGRFDIWMPTAERLNPSTRFLQPDVFNTLGIPATVENVISVGSYNYLTNTISTFSGRGIYGNGFIKPDVIAPGENITSFLPGGNTGPKSGTSMAAPHVSGICALIMQWGIVQGSDPFLYGDRLRYYLLRGAKRIRREESYPNPTWGYGVVCAKDAVDMAKLSVGGRSMDIEKYDILTRAEKEKYKINQVKSFRQVSPGVNYLDPTYANYVIEYDGDIVGATEATGFASAFILDENYAVLSVKRGREEELTARVKEIVFIDPGRIYTLCQVSPLESANILQFHKNPYLTLTGQGVLLGILDTGIDYMNLEFMFEDDTSKILRLWDQSISMGKSPQNIPFGSEYTRDDINKAIKSARSGGDPYAIVPSKDINGHGTHMCGLMGAKGRNPILVGAAPDSRFIVVKLKSIQPEVSEDYGVEDTTVAKYNDTDIILALKYIYNVAKELNTPISILVPVGSNLGGHDGTTILEKYIDQLTKIRGIVISIPTGNEGFSDTHTEGKFDKTGDIKIIELSVAPEENELMFEIWCNKPDKISLGVVSPSGEVIEKIPARRGEVEQVNFVYEKSILYVKYFIPEEATGDELIRVRITNIREGIWQFRLYGDLVVDGRYNSWIPQRDLIKEGTRFLNPNQFITLTLPSTAAGAITVGYYNQNNNTAVAQSGRGYTRDGRIKPEISAGGINALTTAVGGGTTTVSGSSVAAAVTAGASALLLQWGIVDGNDPTLYSQKLKTYLIRGANKREGEVYPNPQWGYGTLNLEGVFNNIRVKTSIDKDID